MGPATKKRTELPVAVKDTEETEVEEIAEMVDAEVEVMEETVEMKVPWEDKVRKEKGEAEDPQ